MSDSAGNLARQFEELEVLRSIYGDEWKNEGGSGSYSITLSEGSTCLELFITLSEEYPGEAPPTFQILAPSLKRQEMVEITSLLQEVYLENIGETVIFQWVEKAREWLQEKSMAMEESCPQLPSKEHQEDTDGFYKELPETQREKFVNDDLESSSSNLDTLSIIHGDPITFKKSTFQGHAAAVSSVQQVKGALFYLKKNKKIANATHNIYAYRIYKEETKSFCQDCDDDGETQAGGRLLHLLQIMDVRNFLVVVTRWYGGVHLGPDRFRLINNTARQVIERAGLVPNLDAKRKKKL